LVPGGEGTPPHEAREGFQMPDYRRCFVAGQPVFVTVVTHRRRPWLAVDDNVDVLLGSMRRVRMRYPFRHLAHAVLPDHLHWMLIPEDEVCCSDIVGAVKRDVSWRLKEMGLPGPFWQPRFYDHVIRDEHDLARHLDYIHFNPVRHGYVTRPIHYRHSSFREWVRRDVYDADWGSMEPQSIEGMDPE
jgi:putative transposase